VAIERPGWEVVVERGSGLRVEVSGEVEESAASRAAALVQEYLDHYSLPGARLRILSSIPAHRGLGSGTQLALAVGVAVTRLYGLRPSVWELAQVTDREGSRSGIGVAAFAHGGLVVDGGLRVPSPGSPPRRSLPPVTARIPFPRSWGIVVGLPPSVREVAGEEEAAAFAGLEPMDEGTAGYLARLVLMKLLPAVVEEDLVAFGEAVTAMQKTIGGYFASVQGGVFSTGLGAELAEFFLRHGAAGVGQSSWGPTVYGFAPRGKVEDLVRKARLAFGARVQVFGAAAMNRGALCGPAEENTMALYGRGKN
jgi:beta-RFAP synthase